MKILRHSSRCRYIIVTLSMMLFMVTSATHAVDELYDNDFGHNERPSAIGMVADITLARPAMLVATVLGTAFFIVGLPFSLMGGNVGESGQKLVLDPARSTFVRCLGCVHSNIYRPQKQSKSDNRTEQSSQ